MNIKQKNNVMHLHIKPRTQLAPALLVAVRSLVFVWEVKTKL